MKAGLRAAQPSCLISIYLKYTGPRPMQQSRRLRQGQAHDPAVAALEPFHEHRSEALDAVATGFVLGLPRGPVGFRLRRGDGPEADAALAQGGAEHSPVP